VGSARSRGEDGEVHHHATISIAVYGFLVSERGAFPPHGSLPKFASRNLPFPGVIDPKAPPLRSERHVPNSISTLFRPLIAKFVAILSRCPCCGANTKGLSRRNL